MDTGWEEIVVGAERAHRRHTLFFLSAVVISAALHVLAVSRFPAWPLTSPASSPAVERTPVILDSVIRTPTPARPRAPLDPSRMAPTGPVNEDMKAFSQALEPVLPPPLEASKYAPFGDEAAVARPEWKAVKSVWEPRQEILAVREQLVDDHAAVLPRRIVPDIPRVAQAGDLTLPIELSVADRERLARLPGPSDAANASLSGWTAATLWTGDVARLASKDGALAAAQKAVSRTLNETASTVTDVEAVESVLSLDVRTARPAGDGYAYFEIDIRSAAPDALKPLPKDLLIVQDCSASMTQRKLDRCKEGIVHLLDRLGPDDRYEIMGYNESAYRCFDTWAPNDRGNRAKADWFVESLTARGKTDVLEALRAIPNIPSTEGRPLLVIWITDARPTTGVLDSSAIIEAFTGKNRGRIAVFAVGGGLRVNRFLLDLLAYKNRGDAYVVRSLHDLPEALDRVGAQLSQPLMSDLEFRFSGLDEAQVFPRQLTPFFRDRPLTLVGRCPADTMRAAVRIAGYTRDGEKDMVFELDLSGAGSDEQTLMRRWAWQNIYYLMGEYVRTASSETADKLAELGRRYGLSVPYEAEWKP